MPKTFEDFYALYPKKPGPKMAKKKWASLKIASQEYGGMPLPDYICQDVEQRIKYDRKWKGGFIPGPEVYLNQARWEGEIERAQEQAPAPTRQPTPAPELPDIHPLQRAANRVLLYNHLIPAGGVSKATLDELLRQKQKMVGDYQQMEKGDFTPDEFLESFNRAFNRIMKDESP